MFGLDYSPNQKRAVTVCVAVIAVALSVVFARQSYRSADVVLREPGSTKLAGVVASDSDSIRSESDTGEVMVHVIGAVHSPGVYQLSASQRVIDAINAAGGATPDADTQALNLAAKLQDGSQITVPSAGGARSLTVQSVPASGAGGAGKSSSGVKFRNPGEGVVSINTAGLEELQRLPGVGPSTAQKIIDYRQQLGRFARVEQLLDVSGIGPKKFEQMKPFVTL